MKPCFKGCDSNFEVKFSKLIQMQQLPCLKQYVLGVCLKTIITLTNNLTDMIFDDNLSWPTCQDRLTINAISFF